MESQNNDSWQVPLSKVQKDINTIFRMKPYEDLLFPFYGQEETAYKFKRNLSNKVIDYCDALKRLVNDHELWRRFETPQCQLYSLRLRYMIVGNVLKAILIVHKKNQRAFLKLFRKEYTKTFTFPMSNNKVKIVVLQPINPPNISNRYPSLNITRSPRRSRFSGLLPSENNEPVEVHADVPVTSHFQVPVISVQDPVTSTAIAQIQTDVQLNAEKQLKIYWKEANSIKVFEEKSGADEVVRRTERTSEPIASTSKGIEERNREMQVKQFLLESGLGIEGFENVTDPIELDRILEEGIRRVRRLSMSSQVSDNFRPQFPVQAEVHPIPDRFRSPEHIPQHITERIVSQHIASPTHRIQVDKSAPTAGINLVTATDADLQNVRENISSLTITHPIQAHVPVESAIEKTAQSNSTSRPTIADLIMRNQTAEPRLSSEIMKVIDQPGPIVEVSVLDPLADAGIGLPVPSERRRIGDMFPETLPVKRRPRQKYVFHSNLVIDRRLNLRLKPQNPVSNAENLQNAVDFELRHENFRILPLDQYVEDEKKLEFISHFEDLYDEMPQFTNMADDILLCQLFEPADDVSEGENEFESKMESLRRSIRFPQRANVQQFRSSLRVEKTPRKSSHFPDFDKQPFLQIPAIDAPSTETRTSVNLLNVTGVPLQIPANELPATDPKSLLLQSTIQVPTIEVQSLQMPVTKSSTILPESTLLQPIAQDSNVEVQSSVNLIQTTEVPLQIPTMELPNVLSKSPVFQPAYSKVTEFEEVVPHKRSRCTLDQNIVNVSEIPAGIEQQGESRMPQTEPVTGIVAPVVTAPIEQQIEWPRRETLVPEAERAAEILVPVVTAPFEQQIEEVEEVIIPRRKRISEEHVLEKLTTMWLDKSGGSVHFSELCPAETTDRFIAASTFGILLSLSCKKILTLDQEPESWSPQSLTISPA